MIWTKIETVSIGCVNIHKDHNTAHDGNNYNYCECENNILFSCLDCQPDKLPVSLVTHNTTRQSFSLFPGHLTLYLISICNIL